MPIGRFAGLIDPQGASFTVMRAGKRRLIASGRSRGAETDGSQQEWDDRGDARLVFGVGVRKVPAHDPLLLSGLHQNPPQSRLAGQSRWAARS